MDAGAGSGEQSILTILSYNVENLFDAVDNGTEYRDYDPGEGEWSEDLFHAKMLRIAEVIGSAVPKGPDILALQEIENENVLETLRTEGLKNLGYRYSAIIEAPDSAVQTAVLSRFPITAVKSHALHLAGAEGLRHILELEIEIDGRILYLLNNHWKSKSGGAEETEPLRIAAAALVKRRIGEIHSADAGADIVVCGDLNENHDEETRVDGAYPVALLQADAGPDGISEAPGLYISGERSSGAGGEIVLYSPWFEESAAAEGTGSYMYRNVWETIDHFLLAPGLFDDRGFVYSRFDVVDHDFMLTEEGYPRRWSRSSLQGYSDHLPLFLELELLP